jgi:hypothetical protein
MKIEDFLFVSDNLLEQSGNGEQAEAIREAVEKRRKRFLDEAEAEREKREKQYFGHLQKKRRY